MKKGNIHFDQTAGLELSRERRMRRDIVAKGGIGEKGRYPNVSSLKSDKRAGTTLLF